MMNTTDSSFSQETLRIASIAGNSVIFILSCVGNGLVLGVVFGRRRMRTVINVFLANLSIADLGITLFAIPFDLVLQENNHEWPYGAFMCNFLYPLQTTFTTSGIFTMVILSIERFRAIVYPLKDKTTVKKAVRIISFTWFISFLINVPYMTHLHLRTTQDGRVTCQEHWDSMGERRIFTLSLFLIQYVIPLLIILPLFIVCAVTLKHAKIPSVDNSRVIRAIHLRRIKQNKHITTILFTVAIVFSVFMFPTQFMWLWLDFGSGGEYEYFEEVLAICNIMTFAHSVANPVIYGTLSEDYRKGYRRVLRYFRGKLSKKKKVPTATLR